MKNERYGNPVPRNSTVSNASGPTSWATRFPSVLAESRGGRAPAPPPGIGAASIAGHTYQNAVEPSLVADAGQLPIGAEHVRFGRLAHAAIRGRCCTAGRRRIVRVAAERLSSVAVLGQRRIAGRRQCGSRTRGRSRFGLRGRAGGRRAARGGSTAGGSRCAATGPAAAAARVGSIRKEGKTQRAQQRGGSELDGHDRSSSRVCGGSPRRPTTGPRQGPPDLTTSAPVQGLRDQLFSEESTGRDSRLKLNRPASVSWSKPLQFNPGFDCHASTTRPVPLLQEAATPLPPA